MFCGDAARSRAEIAAAEYLDRQSLDDDPDAAAILTMEGWS